MTQRLYYGDAYLTEFRARVLSCAACENGWHVTLDRSAFYPTSGGQPFDTGMIGDARVLDVYPEPDGEVAHITDAPLPVGSEQACKIDWARRFDHMQQHAADHMIAGVLYRRFHAHTIGLHIGADFSTIDVEMPENDTRLDIAALDEIEDAVNMQVQENLPIRCFFPTEAELPSVPFRKPPTVQTHVRAVMIGDIECVACGGTHPRATGEIGVIKILETRPSRGKMRVKFLAGMRAVRDYRDTARAAHETANGLSCQVFELPDAVARKIAQLRDAKAALAKLRADTAIAKARALYDGAASENGMRIVQAILPELDAGGLRDAASAVVEANDAVALLANGESEGALVVFARGNGVSANMGALLGRVAKMLGGKGGGRPDFAQGALPGRAALNAAEAELRQGE